MIAQAGQRVEVGADADGAVRLGVLERDRRLRGEQLGELELVGAERGLVVAHPADVERADRLAVDEQRDDDHRLGLERGAGHLDRPRVEVGAVGEDGLAVVDDPAGQPGPERDLVGEDQLREPVAGDHRATAGRGPVDPVDGQRVVRHDRPERIGDEVEDAGRFEGRQQPLVDLEQAALALELELELAPLVTQPLHVRAVDEGLGRVAGEDRQRRLVVVIEAVEPVLRQDDDPVDRPVERHRHDEHRLGALCRADDERPRVARRVAQSDGLAVLGDPAGEPGPDRHAEQGGVRVLDVHERALEGDGLAHPGLVVDAIDADGVVVEQAPRLRHDGLTDAGHVLQPVEPGGQLRDGAQAAGHRPGRVRQAGAPDGGRHVVRERPGELRLVGRPVVVRAVVQDQQAERCVAEHDRDEADRPHSGAAIGGANGRHRRLEPAAEDADLALAEGVHPGRAGVARELRDDVEDLGREAALGDQPQWRRAVVIGPQAGLVDAEQRERLVDDVTEQPVEVVPAADLGGDPPERGRTRREVGDRRHGRVLGGSLAGDDHRCDGPSIRTVWVGPRQMVGCRLTVRGATRSRR